MTAAYKILALNVFGVGLLAWACGLGETGVWDELDRAVFFFFNERLVQGSMWLTVTAYTNLRAFDVVAFASMGLVFLHYFMGQPPEGRRRMISMGILMLISAVVIKQCGRFIPIEHPSPTLSFDNVSRLTSLVDISTKDSSGNSFPGDHGMMLMIFTAFLGRYFGRRAFLAGTVLVFVFAMPRIASGAHWFSDVYAGSLAICSITMSWLLLTPASDKLIALITRHIPWKYVPMVGENSDGARAHKG